MEESSHQKLSQRDLDILEFEQSWWESDVPKDQAVREILKSGKDSEYFVNNFCRIPHSVHGLVRFDTYDFQDDLLISLEKHRFNVVLKARQMGIVNAGIGVMSVLLFAFIFSFSTRQTQTGVPIKAVTFPTSDEAPKLATEIYEANPVLDIEVEIPNGCGEPGVAAKFSEFLRDKRVDVVRSENADNFDYSTTLLIQRN